MYPKGKIIKKVVSKTTPSLLYNKVPFLDRDLQSILRFMQENRAMNEQAKRSSNIDQPSALSVNIEQASAPLVKIEQTSTPLVKIEKTSTPLVKIEQTSTSLVKIEQTSTSLVKIEKTSTPLVKIEQTSTSLVKIEQTSTSLVKIEQVSVPSEQDPEIDMFYTIKNKYPFDPLSKKQMEVYGHTFSIDSNVEAMLNFHPPIIVNNRVRYANYEIEEQPRVYAAPIGPMSFLCSTIPRDPNPTFVNFLQACSK